MIIPVNIKLRVEQIKLKIDSLYEELREIQDKCKHLNHSKVPNCNDGNYDPSRDRYWYDCHCYVCDKIWTEDQ
jgi:hypothetical protein